MSERRFRNCSRYMWRLTIVVLDAIGTRMFVSRNKSKIVSSEIGSSYAVVPPFVHAFASNVKIA